MTEPSATWTDDRIAMLRRLWAAGASAAQIAVALDCGLSRSAVLGKAHRLKLERRMSIVHRAVEPKVAPRNVKVPERKFNAGPRGQGPTKGPNVQPLPAQSTPVVEVARQLPAPASLPFDTPSEPSRPVRLAQLDAAFRKCRWIVHRDPARVGRDLYCGAPTVPGRSWCRHHNELACDRSSPRRSERSAMHARAAE